MIDQKIIDEIRSSSRIMVRELGFMSSTLAATDYSSSAVHSLLELKNRGSLTAVQLGQILGLEKSSVSRMLIKLVQLWTFSGLSAARKLYENFGFKLTNEWQGDQWGRTMLEQQFTRINNEN